jgi:hypothetical protein
MPDKVQCPDGATMQERDFYSERQETKPATFTCPSCRQPAEYSVRWLLREKKKDLPRGASNEDRQRFAKARSYMVRLDEMLACRNPRCRKRFEIPTHQSVILL